MRLLVLLCFFIYCVSFISCNQGLSQTGNFTFTFIQIPLTDPDLNKPGAGAEQWNYQNVANIPDPLVNSTRLDAYYRFSYTDIAPFSGSPDTYDFSLFD